MDPHLIRILFDLGVLAILPIMALAAWLWQRLAAWFKPRRSAEQS